MAVFTNWYNFDLVQQAELAEELSTVDTELVITGEFITAPCVAVISASTSISDLAEAEHIPLISSVDQLTFTLGVRDNPSTWPAGSLVLGYYSPLHFEQLQNVYNVLRLLPITLINAVDLESFGATKEIINISNCSADISTIPMSKLDEISFLLFFDSTLSGEIEMVIHYLGEEDDDSAGATFTINDLPFTIDDIASDTIKSVTVDLEDEEPYEFTLIRLDTGPTSDIHIIAIEIRLKDLAL